MVGRSVRTRGIVIGGFIVGLAALPVGLTCWIVADV